MIENLTIEQKNKLIEYRDKWLAIGTCTKPANRKNAEEGIKEAYKIANQNNLRKIVWCGSPLSLIITKNIFINSEEMRDSVRNSVGDSVGDSVVDSVRNSVGDSVGDSVVDSVRNSVDDSVGDSVVNSVWKNVGSSVGNSVVNSVVNSMWENVGDSVGDSVVDSVRNSVGDSVGDSVVDSVRNSVKNSMLDSVWNYCAYGQHDAPWLGFYDYFNNVLNLEKQTNKLKGLWMIAQNAGWFIPHENICWISERHNICKLENGVIHCDGGPAIAYPDGFSIWALHGIRVKKEIAETPAILLDPKLILTEKNTEIRREIVRKIGIQRIIEELDNKTIDKMGNYELLNINIGDNRYRPYLKMLNPSIEQWHIEGVHPDCKTIEQALNWRNGTDIKPEILT